MDIVLLRTFLEVARTRHFGRAASALALTQSGVSARVKLLESDLGVSLFSRKRNDIQLTPAGNRLRRHAETIVRGWERARLEVALEPQFSASLAVGCVYDLWRPLVRDWALTLRRRMPGTALQIEAQPTDLLVQRLSTGLLDLAFMFDPPQSEELVVRQVCDVPLVLVSTRPDPSAREALAGDYVMVDWGGPFAVTHGDHFPGVGAPALRVSLGSLALDLLSTQGGSAYLTRQLAGPAIATGLLHEVPDAPIIERSAYVVYPPETSQLPGLKEVLAAAGGGARSP